MSIITILMCYDRDKKKLYASERNECRFCVVVCVKEIKTVDEVKESQNGNEREFNL